MFPSRVTELVVTRGTIGYQKKTWRKSVDLYRSIGPNRLATKPSQSEFYYSNLLLTNGQILPKPKTISKPGKFKLFLMCDRIQNTVPAGFCNLGYSGRAGFSDQQGCDGPPSVHK